ncbi:DUF4179 domain-containing protein [Agathobaculum sp.]|uniref:DUF4179 domain-containing protein n=1 Tax=Agathobaculum sp. TaxID=2048138 RepID=UPI002A82398F|nr:DUF4179 domain-containing protein [Agathobaculum sp.]MCI5704038.1 DUF4179 domain-containing protein [Pseudoflavonifractor sp.]MDY3618560.1 DUF4179 domain-containing protein [Agathobaculum sp.]
MNKEYNDNKEYNEALSGLRFSAEAKAGMVQNLLDAAGQPVKRRARRPLPRLAVAGIAAALVLSIGAGATVVYNKLASESFAGVFGTAHTEIVDKIGRPIGASATDNGVTVTADAIIGDKYSYAVVYTITRDDGTAFDLEGNEFGYLPLYFEESDTSIGHLGGMHGGSYFIDETPGDNAIQFVEMRTADAPLKETTAKAKMENLRFNDGDDDYLLVEGTWKLKFDFAFEDASLDLAAGQTLALNGMDVVINEITLSPIGLQVNYTVGSEIEWSNAPSGREDPRDAAQSRRYFEDLQILLTKTDGTVIDMSQSGGGIRPKNGKTECQKGGLFDEILSMDEVASLTVGGVDIPL